jgi:uncharacterized membrane protein YidH (DUF202 family)
VTRPTDPGLQPERTSLAWRRTAMSVLVGSLALAKMLANDLPVAGVVLAAVGLIWTVDLALTARRRYPEGISALTSVADRGPGVDVARTAAVGALVGVVMLSLVVAAWLR